MKILCSGVVLFLFAVCGAAQAPATAPDVTVLESKWRSEIYNPGLDKDPLSASKDRQRQEEDSKTANTVFPNKIKQGETPEKDNGQPSVLYIYEAKVTNTGQKEIRTLVWEYVFFKLGTIEEVGRRRLLSKVSIKPGATKHLQERSKSSPTGAVEAAKAGKKTREQYSEQVLITSIGYADGSTWSVQSK